MSGSGGGFAGTSGGSFFKAPGWVNAEKPPGTTIQKAPSWGTWARNVAR